MKTITLDIITDAALVGSGAYPKSGEISLSHNGEMQCSLGKISGPLLDRIELI